MPSAQEIVGGSDERFEVLELPNVTLQKGGLLPLARLAYRTLGDTESRA